MFDINVLKLDDDVVVNKDFLKDDLELFDIAISKLDHQEDDADVKELFYYEDLRRLYIKEKVHNSFISLYVQFTDTSHWFDIASAVLSGFSFDVSRFERDYGITYKDALKDLGIDIKK